MDMSLRNVLRARFRGDREASVTPSDGSESSKSGSRECLSETTKKDDLKIVCF